MNEHSTTKNSNVTAPQIVRGQVIDVDGSPVVREQVQAYIKRLRGMDQALGKPTHTDKDGRYAIEYDTGKRRVDLYVQVRKGKEVLATSPVVLGAGADEKIDMVVGGEYRGPSYYEHVLLALSPVLDEEGVRAGELANFSENDLALLSAKSGVDPRELVLLKQSATLSKDTGLPAELFYGLGRQRMLLSLPALFAQDPAKRRAAAKAAIDAGQIPTGVADAVEHGLAKLDELTVEEALRDPQAPGETTLGGLLDAAGLPPDKRKKLVEAYVKHDGSNDTFWKRIRRSRRIYSKAEIDRVQLTLQLGAVTQNHLPLVKALLDKNIEKLKDLAKLDKTDWLQLIQGNVGGQPVGLPADLQAAGLTDDDYAEMIFSVVEDAFPTAMVTSRIEAFPDSQLLKPFFEANPAFEMRTMPVSAYLQQNPQALDLFRNEADKAIVTKRLKGLERVYRIGPDGARVETMQVLLQDGVDSAQKIRVIGKATLKRRYEKRLGKDRVEKIWAKANDASAVAAVLLARHHAMFDREQTSVLPKRVARLKKFPSYESLFGSLDFCSCEHCQSLYSPAAYLVDVLHWLHNRPSKKAGKTALDILFDDRRAEIGNIELSCKNTNTVLPYIDLVNEVLELLTAPPAGAWPAYQTTGTQMDLLAHPEHLYVPAYEVLAGTKESTGRDAIYPFNLPYNLWLDEARTYLGQLGITRHSLMDVCHDGEPSAAWKDVAVAAEVLGASPIEWDIIAGNGLGTPRSLKEFWGMSGEANWASKLTEVSLILHKATVPLAEHDMGFDELADLLRADFVQAPGAVGVWFDGSTCDTTKATLVGLRAAHLDRLHRFLRLLRRLGWTVSDLDRAIDVLGGGRLDEPFLVKLSHVRRLMADLDLPLDEIFTWWGHLDTRRWRPRLKRNVPAGAPEGGSGIGFVFDAALTPQPVKAEDQSQYDRLFQSPTTTSVTDNTFGIAQDGAALLDETKYLVDHIATVTGALRITAEDLAALLPILPDAKLSLANLSKLYRYVSLARKLELSVRQIVSVIELTGINPFDSEHTEHALKIVQEVRSIRESEFSIEELDYLLRHVDTKPATQEPTSDDIGMVLLELRDALRNVENDHPIPAEVASADDLSGQLASKLAVTLTASDVARALEVVDLPTGDAPPTDSGQVIDDLLKDFLDTTDAKMKLADDGDASYLSERRARLLYVLGAADSEQDLRDRLNKYLTFVLSAPDVELVLAIVDVSAGDAPPANAGQIIDDRLSDFLDSVGAKKKLANQADPAYLGDRRARLVYTLGELIAYIRKSAKQSAIIEKLSTTLGLETALCAPLLRLHLKHPDAAGDAVIGLFVHNDVRGFEAADDSGEPVVPEPADLPEQFAAYKRVHKAAMVLSRFRVAKEELDWVMVQGPSLGTLDVQSLPIEHPAPSNGPLAPEDMPYGKWARLRDCVVLRDRLVPKRLFDILGDTVEAEKAAAASEAEEGRGQEIVNAAHEGLLSALEARTRWSKEDIEFLVGTPTTPGALGFDYPNDWKHEKALKRLSEVMAVVRCVGLPAKTLWGWRAIPLAGDFDPADESKALASQRLQAEDIKQAVRARYGESSWHDVARPLRDRLRERQREALVGCLIAYDGRFEDVNGLFEHLLLDVQMSPCQLTSRIKQAVSSVQLYVQHSLMNLEAYVELSSEDAREWKWMKNYRVWEANRKVFLYPENWIEPELRDDKSPFFEELEKDLLQSEITAESAERAVLAYLEKVDEVARLEVVGFFHQKPELEKDNSTDILHVFARTRGTPPQYFYRQRVDGSRWTPWEKVEVDIEGDHLLPVVYNRRLYIFWAQITEAALEEVPDTPDGGGDNTQEKPVKYFQIRLAWTERRNGKWAGKKLSTVQIGATQKEYYRQHWGLTKKAGARNHDFFFLSYEDNNDLIIEPIRCLRDDIVTESDRYDEPREYFGMPCCYYRLDRFRLSGCDGTLSLDPQPTAEFLVRKPDRTVTVNQCFARIRSGSELTLPATNPVSGSLQKEPTLSETPSAFEVVPHKVIDFKSVEPFFYQDLRHTFFVEPRDEYKWVRQPPKWTVSEQIPLDIPGLLPEIHPRPKKPPQPDPYIYEAEAFVTDPPSIELVTTPALIAKGEGGPGGLLAVGTTGLGETFGPRVAFIGAEAVDPRPNKVAVRSVARVVSDNPGELLTLRSTEAPAEAKALRVLKMDTTYYLPSSKVEVFSPGVILKQWDRKRYRFGMFYHPYLCVMMRQLNRFGLDGLLDPSPTGPEPQLRRQRLAHEFFEDLYGPLAVDKPYPKDEFDFSFGGAYSLYNWELFFHVPFLLACHLSDNQRFEDALRWFHYIFDPTESSSESAPQRFWKFRPFFELFHSEDVEAGPIHELFLLLHYDGSDPEMLEARDGLIEQVAEWRKRPFNPHAIARLRPTAYQKAVFMKYIDNLIEWGDQLFRRDTMESVNEATQLYVLAMQLLGCRPRQVEVEPPAPRTFYQLLAAGLDEFSNALIEEIEGFLPEITSRNGDMYDDDLPVVGPTLFFCVPPNEKLLTDYWDRVADRLFKLRHCMNIEGVVRQLPLFEPPIDPALLVRAASAGVDLASALTDLNAPLPHHRFQILAQKATELCADVRGLGQALLSALEKKDAEELALLRAGHEIKLQTAVIEVREKQIDEAKETLDSLKRSKENAEIRLKYYRNRLFMNPKELLHVGMLEFARTWESRAQIADLVGSIVGALPNFDIGICGFGGSPIVKSSWGSPQMIQIAKAVADGYRMKASGASHSAQMANIMAGYERRMDDWILQGDVAQKEIEGLERQILAAEIRVAVAEKELDNLKAQIDHANEAEEFLRNKYTNQQLYQWMVGQLSSLYFQSYKLAYDLAKRAERAWQFELSQPDRSFIQFGYWDGLKKGLLAGERLHHDIKRMEVAHLDVNRREYELTNHMSLRKLDPIALLQLRLDGECIVRVPEAWFDLDSPGHYMRRIKTVAVSIPAVTGPYVPVRCTLTLLRSSVRISSNVGPGYARTSANDPRFCDDVVGQQSVVTSRGQEDSGLFETNLRDERYLPFEGAGAESEWRLELPKSFRQFDYDTISDVVLHVRYTAREGGAALKQAAEGQLYDTLQTLVLGSQDSVPVGQAEGLFHAVSARRDFPDAWAHFLNPKDDQHDQAITLGLDPEQFPFAFQGSDIKVAGIELFLVVRDIDTYAEETPIKLSVTAPGEDAQQPIDLESIDTEYGRLPHGGLGYGEKTKVKDLGDWIVTFKEADNEAAAPSVVYGVNDHKRLNPSAVEDLIMMLRYKVEVVPKKTVT